MNLYFYEIAFWVKKENISSLLDEIKNFITQKEDEKILKEHPKFGKLYWILACMEKSKVPQLEKFLRSSKDIDQFIIIKLKKKPNIINVNNLEEKLKEIVDL